MTPALWIATLGGVGRLRPGPGTWGSAIVLPLAYLGPAACLTLACVMAVAGFWSARLVLTDRSEDPGWFVADEAAGMLLTLAGLEQPTLPGIFLAFALFRALDIVKPWPVSWADRQGGATGVMFDDLIAGILGALGLMLFICFYPEALG